MRTTRKRILVVEDDDDTRVLLHDALADAGHYVVSVRDGAQAVPLIHMTPDLVLLDLSMPRMDGRSFLRRLGSTEKDPSVLIVTGDLGAITPEMSGARVLAKPFDLERLLFEVESLTA